MSIFDEAKNAAAGMAEQLLKEKAGITLDLDGSDKAVVETTEEEAPEETIEGEAGDEAADAETTEEVAREAAPAGGIMDQVVGMAKNAGLGMVEQKLNMDLDGDGTIGQ